MLELIRCTFEGCGDFPGASECVLKFVNAAFHGIRLNCMTGKDSVSDQVGVGIPLPGIDQLSMTRPLLLD